MCFISCKCVCFKDLSVVYKIKMIPKGRGFFFLFLFSNYTTKPNLNVCTVFFTGVHQAIMETMDQKHRESKWVTSDRHAMTVCTETTIIVKLHRMIKLRVKQRQWSRLGACVIRCHSFFSPPQLRSLCIFVGISGLPM